VTETASKKPSVLLVDDEIQIRRLLRVFLERNGFEVFDAESGEDGIGEAARCNPDLILLDLGLPDIDGITVLRRVREWSIAPVLVLSVREQEDDKITALNSGADDYITKPFSTGELLARLRVAQRHIQPVENRTIFRSGQLFVDLASRTIKLGDRNIKLTATEYELFCLFVTHAGKVLTHGHILHEIWGEKGAKEMGYLRVYIARLREKLEANPAEPELLITEPGVGYRLVVRE
jgi:two-component system KDP operon response regulator KdpE